MIKKISLACALAALVSTSQAQTDVTSKYIQNADFGARFAAWMNPGSFNYSTGTNFEGKSGEVFMEKWVSSGGKLGTNSGMKQTLRNLKEGTYTLVVAAKNIQQSNKTKAQTGAYIFAGDNQLEFNEQKDYSLVFTATEGTTLDIGVRLNTCTGNWVCIDNFRLYWKEADADSLAVEKARVEEELATLKQNLENPTGNIPKVVTNSYVAMGSTVALGRSTITANGATIKERGFCWSTEPNPTILDNKTTDCFSETGNLYRMEGLQPATIYYVRAYALTNGYQVGYGNVVKIATMPKGTVTCQYDYQGSDEEDWRINSAMQECVWMYNNLSAIKGINLNVHYVYGAGAGGGTADCSYGGWMRVSQNAPYQQTGTLLHETNHGVGVGTTGEWYNNSNLRSNTSSGKWLGPRATQMVRFLENNEGAYMQGDGTHMWAGTATGTLKYGYGINGAHEDSYQPSNQLLYYGNVLITHAMHQDGLISTSSVGFATPAYVFTQDDATKYYIKCENGECGGTTSFLGLTANGTPKNYEMTAEEAQANDDLAWNITFDPKTGYYIFYNVGQGKYLTNSSNSIKGTKKTSAGTSEKFHLMPCREDVVMGSFKGTSYWMLTNSGHYALQGQTNYTASTASYSVTTTAFDASNANSNQRWLFLTADELSAYDKGAVSTVQGELNSLITNVKKVVATPHISSTAELDVATIDAAINSVISKIENEKDSYTSPSQITTAINTLTEAFQTFLAEATASSEDTPFDLTFLLANPNFDTDFSGWTQTSGTATWSNKCIEFYEENYDFNQTTSIKVPKGTYEVRVQAFQRPGSYNTVYSDFVTNNNDKGTAFVYAKTKQQIIKNICAEHSTTSITGSKLPSGASKFYIPDNMQSAQTFFTKGYYDNAVQVTTTVNATFKLGIKLTKSDTSYWTCADNFRLYFYGNLDVLTGVEKVADESLKDVKESTFDLSGRRITKPLKNGIYIKGGKKVIF